MFTLVATVHVIVGLMLILLVLVQDSKGGAGMFAGGSSQSILGATGGATLLAKMTRVVAIVFAVTSIMLTIYTAKKGTSVIEGAPIPQGTTTLPPAGPTTEPVAKSVAEPAGTPATAPTGETAPAAKTKSSTTKAPSKPAATQDSKKK